MLWRSIKKSAAVATFACSMAFASHVSALDTGDSRFLGQVNDGIPSDLASEVIYINTLLAQPSPSGPTLVGTETYTRSANDCGGACPPAVLAGAVKDDSENTTVNLGSGWTYLLAKYDAAQAGAFIWFVGGLTGNVTVPSNLGTCGMGGCGLSHTALFNPGGGQVSEPAPLALLALGLVMLGVMRRRKST